MIESQKNDVNAPVAIPGVGDLTVRPIDPEDAPLFIALFESLSARSVYMRFFTPLKSLSRQMLDRLTRIDHQREIALTAVQHRPDGDRMLAVARVIRESDPKHAEFAVLVSDPWQGKGIGAELLQRCLDIAKGRGIEKIWGVVLSENKQMLALGRKLGFAISKIAGEPAFRLTLTFTPDR